MQPSSTFWKRKIKTIVAKTRTGPKSKKNKPAAIAEPAVVGESADADDHSEVELDSLGQLFVDLADTSCSQDEAAKSRADDIKVIPISSGSDPAPPEKIRRVVWKVKFSHPDAHLDRHFILNKTQHELRRQTRSGGSGDLMAGLTHEPSARKRPAEVPHTPTPSLPEAGLMRHPLNPSDSNYQESPPSSGGSSQTQLSAFIVN
jgi:hypothetical protein